MKLINNLNFNGRCREAFERYAEVLGGKLTAMHTFGEMPGNKVDAGIFSALAEGGRISMPIGETPWSPCFGMLTDRFGTPWMIDTLTAQAAS